MPTWVMELDFPDPGFFIPYFDSLDYRQLNCEMSYQTNILDTEPFTRIRDIILPNLQQIVDKCEYQGDDVGIRITQSWCVKHKAGEYVPLHRHQNSQFSGVCYFNDSPCNLILTRDDPWYTDQPITVFDGIRHQEYFMKTRNIYPYKPQAGKIIIFPSSMTHCTDPMPADETETRYSLAFNTFLTGKILSDTTLASIYL